MVHNNRRGVTLIELLVGAAITGVLSASVVGMVTHVARNQRNAKISTHFQQLVNQTQQVLSSTSACQAGIDFSHPSMTVSGLSSGGASEVPTRIRLNGMQLGEGSFFGDNLKIVSITVRLANATPLPAEYSGAPDRYSAILTVTAAPRDESSSGSSAPNTALSKLVERIPFTIQTDSDKNRFINCTGIRAGNGSALNLKPCGPGQFLTTLDGIRYTCVGTLPSSPTATPSVSPTGTGTATPSPTGTITGLPTTLPTSTVTPTTLPTTPPTTAPTSTTAPMACSAPSVLTGAVGSVVTLNNSHFTGAPIDFTAANNNIKMGGVDLLKIRATPTELVVFIMPGATTNPIQIHTPAARTTASSFTVLPTFMPSVQQGGNMTNIASSVGRFGYQTAISADGNTAAAVFADDSIVVIYTRSTTCTWSQQTVLTPTPRTGSPKFISIALNADGNTLAVGSAYDEINGIASGATYFYVRDTMGAWSQQAFFPGTNHNNGFSVALSADGNTAAVGATDLLSSYTGRAIVYRRTGTTWSQQTELTGAPAAGSGQGYSIALSADGSTLALGNPNHDSGKGNVWVFRYNGSTWAQQAKLTPTPQDADGYRFGETLSLNANGQILAIGGSAGVGTTYVFERSGSTWSEQARMREPSALPTLYRGQGHVSISADGQVLLSGAATTGTGGGTTLAYQRSGSTWNFVQALTGSSGDSTSAQGNTVSMTPDGRTVIIGGSTHYARDSRFSTVLPGAIWFFNSP